MSAAAPVILQRGDVRLEPLGQQHADALAAASADGDIWKLNFTSAPQPNHDAAAAYIARALAGQAAGRMLPFAVNVAGHIVGTTRYYDIDNELPSCAIGHTWYAARVQRSHVNTCCKRLLLGHAFDALGMRTVRFHTSHLNLRSQAAIERLGAHKDGVLRQHMRHKDGSLRDTVCYSILDHEWPAIRDRLDQRLGD